jgi:hypothetical protein
VSNCEIESTNQKFDGDCNLDIFKMIVSTSEQVKGLINKKLLIFWGFQAYVLKHLISFPMVART